MSGSVYHHSTNLPRYITLGCIVIGQLIIAYFLPQSLPPAKRKLYQRREYKCICFLKVGVGKGSKRQVTKVKRIALPNSRLKRLLV